MDQIQDARFELFSEIANVLVKKRPEVWPFDT